MTKLPADFKAKWIAALRSGKYKQGTGCLRKGDQYCPFGVAVDIHLGPDGWHPRIVGEPPRNTLSSPPMAWTPHVERESVFMSPGGAWLSPAIGDVPPDVSDCLGTPQEDGGFVMTTLMELNDTGLSFSQIADWIEEHL